MGTSIKPKYTQLAQGKVCLPTKERDMGSIPVLRAIRRNLWVLQQVKLPVWCNWSSRAGVVLARSSFKSEDFFRALLFGSVSGIGNAADCNSVASGIVGSSPTRPTKCSISLAVKRLLAMQKSRVRFSYIAPPLSVNWHTRDSRGCMTICPSPIR